MRAGLWPQRAFSIFAIFTLVTLGSLCSAFGDADHSEDYDLDGTILEKYEATAKVNLGLDVLMTVNHRKASVCQLGDAYDGSSKFKRSKVIRSLNRQLVQSCLKTAGQNSQKSMTVTSPMGRYQLSVKNGRIQIGVKIRFKREEEISSLNDQYMLEAMKDCRPKVQQLFARSNIDLNLQLEWDGHRLRDNKLPVHEVIFGETHGRDNHRHYNFYGFRGMWDSCREEKSYQQCRQDQQEDRCLTFAHELGHVLSLRDEYKDPEMEHGRVLAAETKPWSVMDRQYFGWNQIELMPRHIQQMIEPVCSAR